MGQRPASEVVFQFNCTVCSRSRFQNSVSKKKKKVKLFGSKAQEVAVAGWMPAYVFSQAAGI